MTMNRLHEHDEAEEIIVSTHTQKQWQRRMLEREQWVSQPKRMKRLKKVKWFETDHVDEELYPALVQLNRLSIRTEFSCAGVSVLDDPENHSLYAYMTIEESLEASRFIDFLMKRMKHRLLVTYEPKRQRYDLSSFFIQHNRSFCTLITRYSYQWSQAKASC